MKFALVVATLTLSVLVALSVGYGLVATSTFVLGGIFLLVGGVGVVFIGGIAGAKNLSNANAVCMVGCGVLTLSFIFIVSPQLVDVWVWFLK